MRAIIRRLPRGIRKRARAWLVSLAAGTISQGWDEYAKRYKAEPGKHLGDEWNEPLVVGIDASPEQMLNKLDEEVFQPFLGQSEVLLEIGSGGGRFTEILLPKCRRLIASDTAPHMLALVKERFKHCPAVEYLLLDGRGLAPVKDATVDAVFSYDVFVHLQPWDIFNYMREMKRVLRPGGKAIVHHANTFSELGWKRFLSDTDVQLNLPMDWGSLSLMTPQVIAEFAARAGLLLVDCITHLNKRDCITLLQSPGR